MAYRDYKQWTEEERERELARGDWFKQALGGRQDDRPLPTWVEREAERDARTSLGEASRGR